MSVPEMLLVVTGTIGALASAVVSILNRRQLKVVHRDTNGNLSALKSEVRFLRRRLGDENVQPFRSEDEGVRSSDVGSKRFGDEPDA